MMAENSVGVLQGVANSGDMKIDHPTFNFGQGLRHDPFANLHPGRVMQPTLYFLGRDTEVQQALAVLTTGLQRLLVTGMGGVGKTELAKAVAAQVQEKYQEQFPFGALMIDLRGVSATPLVPKEARRQLLREMGVTLQHADEEEERAYRRLLAEHPLLLILDNIKDPEQVRELLLDGVKSSYLLTARPPFPTMERVDALPLQLFDNPRAVALLQKSARREAAAAPGQIWKQLAMRCGHLPLFLYKAGQYLRNYSDITVEEMLAEVVQLAGSVPWLQEGDEVLLLSVQQLAATQPQLLQRWLLLTLLRRPFTFEVVAALWAESSSVLVKRQLRDLHHHTLLLHGGVGQPYYFHDRMREIAEKYWRNSAAPAEHAQQTLQGHQRLLDYYLTLLHEEQDPDAEDYVEAAFHGWWAQGPKLKAQLADLCSPEIFWSLLERSVLTSSRDKLFFVLSFVHFKSAQVDALYQELQQEQEHLRGIKPGYAHLLGKFLLRQKGKEVLTNEQIADIIDAHWDNPLILSYVTGEAISISPDRRAEWFAQSYALAPNDADILGNYANFLNNIRQDYARAEELYERALSVYANHANNLGNYALFLQTIRQDYDRAEELYERALSVDANHATNLGNYANLLDNIRQDYARAEELYERALSADANHANNLGNYALFLQTIRQDYDRA
ncbi:tetratricopeptide repeat protein, partial [Candidatus Magnetaquicoccus inordinatus]|uniref:tetratricopeptide repeat protein n=1 Tax=Candidatus Magnetaquicoccus inordinatus TaxID=2496818 RepID=UPI00102B2478